MNTTLVCTDTTVRGAVTINWWVKSHHAHEWKMVLTATERKEFSGSALKESMHLKDSNFPHTGVFSLVLSPTTEDSGLYLCVIQQTEKSRKERIILLAILTGWKKIVISVSFKLKMQSFSWFYSSTVSIFWLSLPDLNFHPLFFHIERLSYFPDWYPSLQLPWSLLQIFLCKALCGWLLVLTLNLRSTKSPGWPLQAFQWGAK